MSVWGTVQAVHSGSDVHPNNLTPINISNKQTVMSNKLYLFLHSQTHFLWVLWPPASIWAVQLVRRLHRCGCFLWLALNFDILCTGLEQRHTLCYAFVSKLIIYLKWMRCNAKLCKALTHFWSLLELDLCPPVHLKRRNKWATPFWWH